MDHRAGSGHTQGRREGRVRPVRHAVLPEGVRLPGGNAVPVGRVRLLAHGRHRVRHRQDPAGAGRRQRDDRRLPEVPQPVGADPRRAEGRPQAGRRSTAAAAARRLEGALQSLYGHYAKNVRRVGGRRGSRANGSTPPVFIVVCNNTNVSKPVFDYIAGWDETATPTASRSSSGRARRCSATRRISAGRTGRTRSSSTAGSSNPARACPTTSRSSPAPDRGLQGRVPAALPRPRRRDLTDEDLMREVLNTVGKPGKLGEHVRCVVSVSMLTEGWDCNTVTHILGVRAFGTRLLCEQVMGRGLRRRSYARRRRDAAPGVRRHLRRAVLVHPHERNRSSGRNSRGCPHASGRSRSARRYEITLPSPCRLSLRAADRETPCDASLPTPPLALSTQDVPTRTEVEPIFGEGPSAHARRLGRPADSRRSLSPSPSRRSSATS